MCDTHIFEGKTTNEAIEKGLKELHVSKRDVDIKVLENEDKRSFFSILAPRIVKVEMTIKENGRRSAKEEIRSEMSETEKRVKKEIKREDGEKAIENVKLFLEEFLPKISSEKMEYEISIGEYYLNVEIMGQDTGFLIGYRGENLNALQVILSSIASKGIEDRIKVLLDISGYRGKREKALEQLAEKISKTVVKNGKSVTLEPMTAYERKIIHEKLQNHHKVKTTSVGEEPYRKVVISLK